MKGNVYWSWWYKSLELFEETELQWLNFVLHVCRLHVFQYVKFAEDRLLEWNNTIEFNIMNLFAEILNDGIENGYTDKIKVSIQ